VIPIVIIYSFHIKVCHPYFKAAQMLPVEVLLKRFYIFIEEKSQRKKNPFLKFPPLLVKERLRRELSRTGNLRGRGYILL
jgi:hypothetical protein